MEFRLSKAPSKIISGGFSTLFLVVCLFSGMAFLANKSWGQVTKCGPVFASQKDPLQTITRENLFEESWTKENRPEEPITLFLKTQSEYFPPVYGSISAEKAHAGLSLKDFTTPHGNVVLFRSISSPFSGQWKPDELGTSASISPKIALDHYQALEYGAKKAGVSTDFEPYMLIAVQNFKTHRLRPHLEDAFFYDLITEKESEFNIVGIVPLGPFAEVMESYGTMEVPLRDFLQKLAPLMQKP